MKTLVGKIVFFFVIAAQGVLSIEVGTLSNASINKAIGENATVVWNVTGIEASDSIPLVMPLGKGELKRKNYIFEFTVYAADSLSLAKVSDSSVHKELASRSTANYTYTGKSSGKETARVSFTINNLTLDDEGSYFLSAKGKFLATNISVNYGPEKCGGDLESEYIVSEGDQLNITMGFCGKPQPIVTCKFDSQTYNSVIATEINQYNYTYAFVIPTKLKSCERKELICTATVDGKLVTRESTVLGNSPPKKKVSGGVCAGHIIGFEIGFILICVFIYVYLVVWNATGETGKLVGFIIAVVVGFALVIGLSVPYAVLRKSNDNDNCGKGSLGDCDKAFIAFGVIDIVALIVVVIISVKVLKDGRSKTLPDGSRETTPLKSANNPSGTVKKTGGATETSEQVHNQNV